MSSSPSNMRILFACPAYWPAVGFGGPIPVLRELAAGLTARGHSVDVVTTSLTDVGRGTSVRTREAVVDGARVSYLATPATYRWMGLTPSLPLRLRELGRPDVVHVFGFRDPVGTGAALWARARGIPYVFEALGMLEPKLRKVRLKRALDGTVLGWVPSGAALAIACSGVERREYLAAGLEDARVVVRPNGFRDPYTGTGSGELRARVAIDGRTPLALYVGRVAAGKGIEFLLDAARALPDLHVAIVGPDDRHGLGRELAERPRRDGTSGRIHVLGAWPGSVPPEVYADADVFVLPSRHESFGMVAAEAASAGVPVVVTDRCGVAELLADAAAIVPYESVAVQQAIARLLEDPDERRRRADAGRRAAERYAWPGIVTLQEELYRRVAGGS